MKRVGAYLFFFLAFLLSPSVSFSASADLAINDTFGPTRNDLNLPISDGFAALKWGASIEDAHRTYTDLRECNSQAYNQYIKGGKDNAAWFVRDKEDLAVGGHSMDSIDYKFQNGKLVAVGIAASCDEDTPCNAEEIYQDIIKAIRRLYGKPYEIASRTYEDDKTVNKRGGVVKTQEIAWKIDDESISASKTVEPKVSSIGISIFSYQGYFIAIGSENVRSASRQSLPERINETQASESSYALSEGFRSIKWGTRLVDSKSIYPDLLFVEQIPATDPKYLYYRRKNENKKFSGLEWDRIRYVFTNEKDFAAADVEMRLELEDNDRAIAQYNDLYQSIVAKYGKPFHAEKTNKEGYPFVYYSIWHIGSESVSLELKALKGHWIYKNSGVENRISMLEFSLNFYSKKAEGKGIDF